MRDRWNRHGVTVERFSRRILRHQSSTFTGVACIGRRVPLTVRRKRSLALNERIRLADPVGAGDTKLHDHTRLEELDVAAAESLTPVPAGAPMDERIGPALDREAILRKQHIRVALHVCKVTALGNDLPPCRRQFDLEKARDIRDGCG